MQRSQGGESPFPQKLIGEMFGRSHGICLSFINNRLHAPERGTEDQGKMTAVGMCRLQVTFRILC